MMYGITHTLPWWVAMVASFAAVIRWEARRNRATARRAARGRGTARGRRSAAS